LYLYLSVISATSVISVVKKRIRKGGVMVNPDNTRIGNNKSNVDRTESEKERPDGVPNAEKDFRKVLATEDKYSKTDKKDVKTASKKFRSKDDPLATDMDEGQPQVSSIFSLARRSTDDETEEGGGKQQTTDPMILKVEKDKPKKDSLFALASQKSDRYLSEQTQPDLAYVNPLSTGGSVQSAQIAQKQESTLPARSLQEIVDQIVDEVYTLESKGQTDTVITLKNIPLFDQVKVTVSAYDSANGQLNIEFSNLTQNAKRILDMNLDGLRSALLDNRNITAIPMLITTTIETPRIEQKEGFSQERNREDQENSGQQRRQQG
jgi:hypothetical protein